MRNEEQVIIEALKQAHAYGIESALSPKELIERCSRAGLASTASIESALIDLIDQDVVEYEMDDNTDVTHIWLLQ